MDAVRGRAHGSFYAVGMAAIAAVFLQMKAAHGQSPVEPIPGVPETTKMATASAVTTQPSFDISFGTLATSDYNYRGYTLSDHKPSVSGYFEATYDILFAGLYASSVKMPVAT